MNTRAIPYGYAMEYGVIIINEAEAEIIRKIYTDRTSGIGVYAIGKELYEQQIPYFSDSRDKAVKKASGILYKSYYTGEGRYPAIVSKEAFEKVQSMKSAAFRKKATIDTEEQPVNLTELDTEYTPTDEIDKMEQQIRDELQSCTKDSTAVRSMILALAAKKYECIKIREE